MSPGPLNQYSFDFPCIFFPSSLLPSLPLSAMMVISVSFNQSISFLHSRRWRFSLWSIVCDPCWPSTSCIFGHRTLRSHIYTSPPPALIQAKGGYFRVTIGSRGKKYISTLLMVMLQSHNSCLANILIFTCFKISTKNVRMN